VRKKIWKLIGAELDGESGDLGGGGKGRRLSPFIPRISTREERLGRRKILGFGFGTDSFCFAYGLTA